MFLSIYEQFSDFILVFFLLNGYMFGWRASQNQKSFDRISTFYSLIASIDFGPTFFEQHDPNLFGMRLGIKWFIIIFARKSIISFNSCPFTINKQFNTIVMSFIDIKQKSLRYQFWVERDQ
jgi:hypothetical protein